MNALSPMRLGPSCWLGCCSWNIEGYLQGDGPGKDSQEKLEWTGREGAYLESDSERPVGQCRGVQTEVTEPGPWKEEARRG